MTTVSLPLQNVFFKPENTKLKQTVTFLSAVLLLAFASQLSIPFFPVPLTFQSATVILIGMTFGKKRGAAVVAVYLAAGAIGLPVFAGSSAGITKFIGPTGGYLLGFLPAAYVSGYLAERGFAKRIGLSFLAACISAAIIFTCGITMLTALTNWHNAVIYGLLPFIIAEPIKLLAAACVVPACWK